MVVEVGVLFGVCIYLVDYFWYIFLGMFYLSYIVFMILEIKLLNII